MTEESEEIQKVLRKMFIEAERDGLLSLEPPISANPHDKCIDNDCRNYCEESGECLNPYARICE